MTRFQKILTVSFVLIVLGGVAGMYFYQKPPRDVSKIEADIQIQPDELLEAFQKNEEEARASYAGKILLVKGTIQSVQVTQNMLNVVLAEKGSFYGINCSFKANQQNQLELLSVGDVISVKGLCKGYIDDVIMTQCTVEIP